jgi:hypothetical protein
MNYLDPSEYEAYGLEETTPASLVMAASALVDTHCRRETLGVVQYTERVRLGGRGTVRLTYLPLVAGAPASSPLAAVRVRYGVPRRGDLGAEIGFDAAQAFGLAGEWTALDPALVDYDAAAGDLTFPAHPLGLTYNEAEITYTAGWETIPAGVKCACAQIVRNAQATPALNVRANGIDQMHMEYFSGSLLDESARKLLAPYVAQKVG